MTVNAHNKQTDLFNSNAEPVYIIVAGDCDISSIAVHFIIFTQDIKGYTYFANSLLSQERERIREKHFLAFEILGPTVIDSYRITDILGANIENVKK